MVIEYAHIWKRWEDRRRRILKLLGLGVHIGIVATYSLVIVPFIAVLMNLDPLYFFLRWWSIDITFSTDPIQVALACFRVANIFMLLLTVMRNYWFMVIYCMVTFQAYKCCILLHSSSNTSAGKCLEESCKLRLFHAYISPFTNSVNAILMFHGHFTCVVMFWLSMKGWGQLPDIIVAAYPLGGVITFVWILSILNILSGIQKASRNVIQKLKAESTGSVFLKKRVPTLIPIQFRSGSYFVIGQDAAGSFFNTVVDNVVSAVLTF